jgi:hypothetical protein
LLGTLNDWGIQMAPEVGAVVEYVDIPALRKRRSSA